VHIFPFVAFEREVFDPQSFDMVTANDWKHRRCPRIAIDHAVGVQWQANRERLPFFPVILATFV